MNNRRDRRRLKYIFSKTLCIVKKIKINKKNTGKNEYIENYN